MTLPSQKVIEKLQYILTKQYPIVKKAILYAEIVSGRTNFLGMGEIRDALEHIRRALNNSDESKAMTDLEESSEHLRRAGVESLQYIVVDRYKKIIDIIEIPPIMYKVALVSPPTKKMRELRRKFITLLDDARNLKSDKDKWPNAIDKFIEAMDICFEIEDMFPTKIEIRYRILMILFGIITVFSLIFGILSWFFK